MSFINFNNRTAPEAGTYSARMIAEALYQVETKNINKIKSLVESIKEPLATAEALKMFENKLVALNALQTAAANAMPVNEGQFSWMTQDTGEQIGSERENRITVFMYDNEGNQYKEDKYDGYGEFGGMDYYELLAKMNGYSEEDLEEVKGPFKEMRQLGIDLAFDKLKTKDKGRKVLFPALVTDPRYNWKKHDFTQEPESDPNQSWYVEPEYDEDEYYEANTNEAKKEIKYYKTISKKDWEKAPKDYKSTIDGEHYMMFLDDKLGSILAPVKVEEAYTEDDINGKSLKKEMDKVNAANEGLNWDSLIEKVKNTAVNEWGSSDQSIMNKAIHKDAGSPKKMPSPFDSKLRAAAEDAVDFYWDDWKEYETDRDGLIDNAVRGYLRSYFKKDWDLMVRMFEPVGESLVLEMDSEGVQSLADELNAEVYTARLKDGAKSATIKATTTTKTWDDGAPILKFLARGKATSMAFTLYQRPFTVLHDVSNGWFYFTDGRKWYGLHGDEGYFEPEDLPFDMKISEAVVTEAGMNDPVLMAFRAAKMKREKELAKPKRKPLYGKQREKAEDDLWQISQDLKDLYADRGQMLIDMEQEAEVEGGPIADEYGDKLNKIEDEIQKLIAKRSKLEMRLAESVEVVEDLNERSINKIQKDWANVTGMMKDTVAAWKKAEGQEKEDLLTQLKTLTISKKKLEAELNDAVGLKDADAELVGEATMQEIDKKVQKFVIKNANDYDYSNQDSAFQIYLSLKKLYPSLIKESVVNEAVAKNTKIYQIATPAPKAMLVEELEDLFGDDYRHIVTEFDDDERYESVLVFNLTPRDIKRIQEEIGDVLIWEYSIKKGKEIMESVVNEEDYSDEMSFGQLESCIDNANMIRDRIKQGVSLDAWMHSQIAVAKNELTSVFDALDGDDGVVEKFELTEGVMSDLHQLAGEVKNEEEFIKKFFKEYGAKVKKSPESTEWVKSLYKDTVEESVVTEAKTLDRDEMMDWLEGHLSFVRTSEEFDGAQGGIWTTGENGDEYKGNVIYDYYSMDHKNRIFGVDKKWDKELNKRGWYSEWYDAGTVMIWPI